MTSPRTVLVPAERVVRWFDNFASRHGEASYAVAGGLMHASASDGASAHAALPFERAYDGPATPAALAAAVVVPRRWGVLLVRKGGFAVAAVARDRVVESKVGQRHVQGRTKAGGQSQQRFARRRDNQARQAYEAAAGHAARILIGPIAALVCGGDRTAVELVLEDPRLRAAAALRVGPWLAVPDPRRAVLDQAVRDGCSVLVTVSDPRTGHAASAGDESAGDESAGDGSAGDDR
ncbi:MAG TPA: acVLRF1 family peptidyl-tRNA hydrolase [Nocardioidaceae bacterium]|nr:acVLRF1 family peptidyl-tRNA hydrolase [Nocardioidaceae bacterium]